MTKIAKKIRVEDVTPEQYALAWRLVAAGCTIPQILGGVGITKGQLTWMMREGDESRGMPPFGRLFLEQVAELRGRAQEVAGKVGAAGVKAIEAQIGIVAFSQKICMAIMQMIGAEFQANAQLASGDPAKKPLHRLIPTKQTTETLRVLRQFIDFTMVAQAMRATYDGPSSTRDPVSGLPRDARDQLSPESMMPASLALLADQRGEERSGDPLEDLLPELRGWTEAELQSFAESGKRPVRDFGGDDEGLDD